MSKQHRSKKPLAPETVAARLREITDALPDSPSFGQADRQRLRASSRRASNALIEGVSNLVAENGGSVIGLGFDTQTAHAAIAFATASRSAIAAARDLAQRLEDELLRRRSPVAESAFAFYGALGRLVQAPEGKSFERAHAALRTQTGRSRKPRVAKGKPSASQKPAATPAAASAQHAPAEQQLPAAHPVVTTTTVLPTGNA